MNSNPLTIGAYNMSQTLLITGGAGFIGSHVVRLFVNKYPNYNIINLDKLTYAGNLENLTDIEDKNNYRFIKGDIVDSSFVEKLFQIENIDGVILTSLGIIEVEGGNVLHAMKQEDNGFNGFGEAYFSTAEHKVIKGWKRHFEMTLNIVVPIGHIRFVLYDDRDVRAGVKFATNDLIGMAIQIIIGARNMKENKVEIKYRDSGKSELVDKNSVIQHIEEID